LTCTLILGAFYSTKNSKSFETEENCYKNVLERFSENLEIFVEFPKSEPFNPNSQKFWDESQMPWIKNFS